jgi:hypothetical protein
MEARRPRGARQHGCAMSRGTHPAMLYQRTMLFHRFVD